MAASKFHHERVLGRYQHQGGHAGRTHRRIVHDDLAAKVDLTFVVGETTGIEEFLVVFRTGGRGPDELRTGGEMSVVHEEGLRSLLTSHGWPEFAIDVSLRTARSHYAASHHVGDLFG